MKVLQRRTEKSKVPIELLQRKQKRSKALGEEIRSLGRDLERSRELLETFIF